MTMMVSCEMRRWSSGRVGGCLAQWLVSPDYEEMKTVSEASFLEEV